MTARYTCMNCGFQTAILAESLEHQNGNCPKAKKPADAEKIVKVLEERGHTG